MDIRLKPEMEEMIRREVERGAYRSADEFVERAVALLHEEESWLAEKGSEIRAKIEQGYASAQRGELLDSDRVRQEKSKERVRGSLKSAAHERVLFRFAGDTWLCCLGRFVKPILCYTLVVSRRLRRRDGWKLRSVLGTVSF